MGVHDLWQLLEPTGARLGFEALAGKRVAVDASIWLIQFIKAMRDEHGEMVHNAHLIGFFRRTARLLCNRIRPVFVFDGATPSLKSQTVAARRKLREQAGVRVRRTAEKVLLLNLKASLAKGAAAARSGAAGGAAGGGASAGGAAAVGGPAESTEAAMDGCADSDLEEPTWRTELHGSDEEEWEDDSGFELPVLGDGESLDLDALATLPASMRLELSQRYRERQFAANREMLQSASDAAPGTFSSLQLEQYLKMGRMKRQLNALVNEQAVEADGVGVEGQLRAQRVAGDTTREFVFSDKLDADGRRRAFNGSHGTQRVARRPLPERPRLMLGPQMHPILPPPLPGTRAVRYVPPPSSPEPQQEAEEEADAQHGDASSPQCLDISFDVPSEEEWEDVVEEAGAAAAATLPPVAEAAAPQHLPPPAPPPPPEPQPQAAVALEGRPAALAADADEYGAPDSTEGAAQEAAAVGPSRRHLYKRSHGFLLGRSLDDWAGEGQPVPLLSSSAAAQQQQVLADEQQDVQRAIQESLRDLDRPRAQGASAPPGNTGAVVSLREDGEEPKLAQPAAPMPPAGFLSADDVQPAAAAAWEVPVQSAAVDGVDAGRRQEDIELQLALAASLWEQAGAGGEAADAPKDAGPPSAPPPAPVAVVPPPYFTVLFQGRRWSLTRTQFADAVGALSHSWPEWLPLPMDLEQQPVRVLFLGREWPVVTPVGECLAFVLREAAAAAAAPAPARKQVTFAPSVDAAGAARALPPRHPPSGTKAPVRRAGGAFVAPDAARVNGEATAWDDKWEGVASEWALPASLPAFAPAAGARMATDEDEAFLASAEGADASAAAEQLRQQALDAERAELRAQQHCAAKAAEGVTPEMFAEVQALLEMFGVPFVVAPFEAEAQCAELERAGLVDAVVTDDSDVFLFGAATVCRHFFEQKKFMELYTADCVAQRLGLDRRRLAELALLLGSDYTPGVPGVGIVNALEILHAFPGMDGLRRFKAWVDAPDSELVAAALAKAARKRGKGARGAAAGGDAAAAADGAPGAPAAACESAAEAEFKRRHVGKRKTWVLQEGFPSQRVVDAYLGPQVDHSAERFQWGTPDQLRLKDFCGHRLGWAPQQAEQVLADVMAQVSIRDTQRTVDSFFKPQDGEAVAKVRSKRLRAAIAGLTGVTDPSLALSPDEEAPKNPRAKKKAKKGPEAGPEGTAAVRLKPGQFWLDGELVEDSGMGFLVASLNPGGQ